MVRPGRLDPRVVQRALASVVSAALHVCVLLVVVLSGDRHDGVHTGDTPFTKLLLLEAPNADEREGLDLPPLEATLPVLDVEEPHARIETPASPPTATLTSAPDAVERMPRDETPAAETRVAAVAPAATTFEIPEAERAALAERLEKLAERLAKASPTHVEWEENGKEYRAVLILERANEGTALDRVIAQVSASERGKLLTTELSLKRLPFSQFTQMVDRWDPMVQFHDDEIVGRVHSNSPFNLAYDSRTAPKFLGKVTTAARTFHTDSKGRRRDSDIFKGGLQMRAGRIRLPDELQPFEWAPRDDDARIHELADDTGIRFSRDGSYTLQVRGTSNVERVAEPSEKLVYFIARPGVTLYVEGVVAGKMLVYSPQRIVVEGSLLYAHDPREDAGSEDYLGLVCDKYIEVAPPSVTGPGDLAIEAAIFAGRRFVVRSIHSRRAGTLRIYGSLSAGSVSASEPRYATRIEYDPRFEERRPPGFPSTNRFELDAWNGEWTEVSAPLADEAH